MPIYEYQCQACGELQEVLQKISDPVLKKCPECGKLKLKKLVSAPSFRLSGTGWYETDFKSDKDTQRNLSTKDSQGDDQSKDKKKSDAKGKNKKEDKGKSDKKDSAKKSSSDKSKSKSKSNTSSSSE